MESGANTKEVLTPKNVYRFLTDNLPGLYPHGVIPVAERKGLTLVKFWAQVLDGIIPPEWHASLFGGTQRSRRLSDMMNRTGVQPLPPKLQQEMNALLSGETLIRLSQQVPGFPAQRALRCRCPHARPARLRAHDDGKRGVHEAGARAGV